MKFYTSVNRIGGRIKFRGYDDHGYRAIIDEVFEPILFVPSKNEGSQWKTIYGEKVEPIKFENMYDSRDFIKKYEDVEGFRVYGNTNYVSQATQRRFPNKIEFDHDLIRTWNIDIECQSGGYDENGVWKSGGFPDANGAAWPITAITFFDSKDKHYYTYAQQATAKTNVKYVKSKSNLTYIECRDEAELLYKFIDHWAGHKGPDIVTGWNIRFFDIPYIVNRIKNILGEDVIKSLSPWNKVEHRSVFMSGSDNDTYDIVGIQVVDYMDLFKKFAVFKYGNQESYSLNHIAHVVLGDEKIKYDGSLFDLYVTDYQKFIEYNIKDVELVQRIEDQESFLLVAMTIAYKAGSNISDTLGTVSVWDSILYRYLFERYITVPPQSGKEKTDFGGGYVKEVTPGMYDNVVSFDLASLYPNIIVQWNMSPETISGKKVTTHNGRVLNIDMALDQVDVNALPNHTVSADGTQFSKDKQGFLPSIVSEYYAERKSLKKKQIEKEKLAVNDNSYALKKEIAGYYNEQMAIKLLMNSLYGAAGNRYFRYFDQRIAEAITASGQLSIRWAERVMNTEMAKAVGKSKDYVVAMDTDSLYVNFDPLVQKFQPKNTIDFLCNIADEYFKKALQNGYDNLFKYVRGIESRLDMDREVVSQRAVWTAAKNYAMIINDNEGIRYDNPKYKIMGLSGKKATASQAIRDNIMHIYRLALTGTEKDIQSFVEECREVFNSQSPEDLAAPRGVNGIIKYADKNTIYTKGAQAHLRAALVYNHYIRSMKLTDKYSLIHDGEKMKFLYLNKPNKLKSDVIGFIDALPHEFDIHDHVDYDTVFEKSFLKAVDIYMDAIGWSAVEEPTLEGFFS